MLLRVCSKRQSLRERQNIMRVRVPLQRCGCSVTELAGESIRAELTAALGNGLPFGGIKVIAESGWFAARPSGTEDVYKIYAESFHRAERERTGHKRAPPGGPLPISNLRGCC